MSYLIKKIYKKIKKQTLKFTETPFCILKNREAFELGREQKIPKNVYQTFMYNILVKHILRNKIISVI